VRLLCPDQRRWSNLFRCWNWFDPRAQQGLGEVQIVPSMIDEVAQSVNVDAGSIAAVGVSAGGALAALLAFHHPDRFRAVATVAAPPLIGNFSLQSPKLVMQHGLLRDPALALGTATKACAPLVIIHGRDDRIVNPRCAEQLLKVPQHVSVLAVTDALEEEGGALDVREEKGHDSGRQTRHERLLVRVLLQRSSGRSW
jgi:feruloyl esterase